MESQIFSVLVIAAFGMLVAVSGGIIYLTVAEWRDRRRRDNNSRAELPNRKPAKR